MKKMMAIALLVLSLEIHATTISDGHDQGNGGNIPASEAVSPQEIADVIKTKALPNVIAWLNHQELLFFKTKDDGEDSSNPATKYFEKMQFENYSQYLKPIHVKMDESCFDKYHRPVDGSIYGTIPDTICISAFTLSSKLNKYNFKGEVYALIIHEISHLLKYNEEEAVALQKYALKDFLTIDDKNIQLEIKSLLDNMNSQIQILDRAILDNEYFNKYPLELANYRQGLLDIQSNVDSKRFPVRYLPAIFNDYLVVEQAEFDNLYKFVLATSKLYLPSQKERDLVLANIDKSYGGREHVSVDVFNANNNKSTDWIYGRMFRNQYMLGRPYAWSDLENSMENTKRQYLIFQKELLGLKNSAYKTYE